jgi:hypothetical protein
MPIMKSRMKALKKQYGDKKGEDIYYAMEQEGKNKRKKKKPAKAKKVKRFPKRKR